MKLRIVLALIATFLLGTGMTCTPNRCAQNAVVYQEYIDAMAAGEILDQDQIAKAKLAALFLNISCGWVAEEEVVTVGLENGKTTVTKEFRKDKNGVRVVSPPTK